MFHQSSILIDIYIYTFIIIYTCKITSYTYLSSAAPGPQSGGRTGSPGMESSVRGRRWCRLGVETSASLHWKTMRKVQETRGATEKLQEYHRKIRKQKENKRKKHIRNDGKTDEKYIGELNGTNGKT